MMLKKNTVAAIIGSVLLALFVGLSPPAGAAPSGPPDDVVNTDQTVADAHGWWKNSGQNAWGAYQNDTKRNSGARR